MSSKTSHRRAAKRAKAKASNLFVVHGIYTHCGAVEVALNLATGLREVDGHSYPCGYGCEVCA